VYSIHRAQIFWKKHLDITNQKAKKWNQTKAVLINQNIPDSDKERSFIATQNYCDGLESSRSYESSKWPERLQIITIGIGAIAQISYYLFILF
jgi:hypothetical protein